MEAFGLDVTMLGHGYYAEAEALLHDMFDLLRRNVSPTQRQRLFQQNTSSGLIYWTFKDKMTRDASEQAKAIIAERVVVQQQLSGAAAEYERVRASMPSGVERIGQMEAILAKMRTLAIAGYPLLKEFSESSSPGDRLVAVVMLQVRTNPDYIRWLGARISAERAFIGYHAAVALLATARVLDATHYATIREAIAASKQALGTLSIAAKS